MISRYGCPAQPPSITWFHFELLDSEPNGCVGRETYDIMRLCMISLLNSTQLKRSLGDILRRPGWQERKNVVLSLMARWILVLEDDTSMSEPEAAV